MSKLKSKSIKIPIILAVLSLILCISTTLAYLFYEGGEDVDIGVAKVELETSVVLSNDTSFTPGDLIVTSSSFSRSSDSIPCYVRARFEFVTTDEELTREEKNYLLALNAYDYSDLISSGVAGTKWLNTYANYYYLVDNSGELLEVNNNSTYDFVSDAHIPLLLDIMSEGLEFDVVHNLDIELKFQAIQSQYLPTEEFDEIVKIFDVLFNTKEKEEFLVRFAEANGIQLTPAVIQNSTKINIDNLGVDRQLIRNIYANDAHSEEFDLNTLINRNYILYPEFEVPTEGLEYIEIIENGQVVAYSVAMGNATDLDIVLPRTYLDKPVTTIAENAFKDESITSIAIPDSVTTIKTGAFSGCTSLTRMVIPSSVTTIETNPFEGCDNLTLTSNSPNYYVENNCLVYTQTKELISGFNGQIPDGVKIVGENAYKNSGLTSLTIPSSVTTLETSAFSGMTSLREINYNATNISDLSADNNVFYDAGSGVSAYSLRSVSGITVNVGANVERIPAYLFNSNSNTSHNPKIVTISYADESKVSSIGAYAYSGLKALTNITIPEKVTTIGVYAFAGSENVTTLNYNARLINNLIDNNNVLADLANGNDSALVVEVGVNVERIPAYLFYPNTDTSHSPKITSISYAEGSKVTEIGRYAFYGINALQTLEIPEKVTTIGAYAFGNCDNVKTLYYNAVGISDLSIDNNVLSNLASANNSSLDVVIGREVLRIPAYLFYPNSSNSTYTPNLNSITYESGCKVATIGAYAFYDVDVLSTIIIPEKVTTIGDYAFAHCSNVTAINFNAEAMSDLAENNNIFYNVANGATPTLTLTIGVEVGRVPTNLLKSNSDASYNPVVRVLTFADGGNCTTIGANAFGDMSNITTINYGVANLSNLAEGNNVFYNAGANTSGMTVNITSGVTKVPAYLFYPSTDLTYRPKIKSLSFADSNKLTSIGNYAFYGAVELETINFGSVNVADLAADNNVFYNAGANTSGMTVNITSGVTKVPAYLFYPTTTDLTYNPNIKTLSFADNGALTSIGSYAFYNATKITSIYFGARNMSNLASGNNVFTNAGKDGSGFTLTIGKSVLRIPGYLFYPNTDTSLCPNVKVLTFENNSACTRIGTYAFYGCLALETLEISKNITKLEDYSFYETRGLRTINYNAASITGSRIQSGKKKGPILGIITTDTYYKNAAFSYVGVDTDGTTVNIGADVEKIPDYLFYPFSIVTKSNTSSASATYYAANITSIDFTNAVKCTSIGEHAFDYCKSLTSVNLPNTITSMGAGVFYDCDGLTAISLPSGMTSIPERTYYGCENITSVTISGNITSIGGNAFNACINIETIELGDNITSIGAGAFSGCAKITTITIPEKVTFIGNSAFEDCSIVTTINYNAISVADKGETNYVFYQVGYDIDGVTLNIGANVTKIPAYMFCSSSSSSWNPKITNAIFANGNQCTSIGAYAFGDLDYLASINLPSTITSIGAGAFYSCSKITSLTLADGITTIGEKAFYGCSKLTGITLPSSLVSLGDDAFYSCSAVTSLHIPSTLTTVTGNPFRYCPNLVLTSSSPDYYMDGNCLVENSTKKLICGFNSSVVIPEDVTSIGDYAFYYCDAITNVAIPSGVTSIGVYAFYNCTSIQSVVIPSGVTSIGSHTFYSCTALQSATFAANSLCTSIGDYAFYKCSSLASMLVPDGVVSFGSCAFTDCSSLASINIPNGVTEIPSNFVSGCTSLSSIVLPDGIISIGSEAFAETNITTISIPSGITVINSYTFQNCANLETVIFATSPTSIGSYAFSGCSKLVFEIPTSLTSLSDRAFEGAVEGNITFAGTVADWKFGGTDSGSAGLIFGNSSIKDSVEEFDIAASDGVITYYKKKSSCLIEGTLITLADGSKKKIEDITFDDLLLVWNYDLGCFDYAYPVWIEKSGYTNSYVKVTLENGLELGAVESHGVFNADLNKFVNMCEISDEFNIGTNVIVASTDANGENILIRSKVVSIQVVTEVVYYYQVSTSNYFNIFANDILTVEGGNTFITNRYGFDENVKWDTQLRQEVLNNHSYKYEEFSDIIDYYLFKGLTVAEGKYLVELGYLTEEEFRYFVMNEVANYDNLVAPNTIVKDGQEYRVWKVTTSNDFDIMFNEDYVSYKVIEGESYILPEAEKIEGKTFVGWLSSSDGKIYDANESVQIWFGTHFTALYE